MAKNGTAGYDPRQIWATNLAPLVTAAREGGAHAARAASRERARVRHERLWWRQRWLVITAGGLAVAGAAGGVYAALASRRSRSGARVDSVTGKPSTSGVRSTMEASRGRVAGTARALADKVRSSGSGDRDTESHRMAEPASPLAASPPDGSRDQAHVTGSGYRSAL